MDTVDGILLGVALEADEMILEGMIVEGELETDERMLD